MLFNSNTDIVAKTQAELHVYADGTLGNDANAGLQEHAGTGGSLSATAGVVTFTVGSGTPFLPGDVGKLITINYATNPGNNGSFAIATVVSTTQVTYANVRGVNETLPAGGKWALSSPKKTLAAVFALVPYMVSNNVCVHLSGTFTDASTYWLEKLVALGANLVVDGGTATTPVSMITGTGDSFGVVGSTVTLTDAGANFTSNLVGKTINITGATTAGNSGFFTVTAVPSPTTIQFTKAGFVAEAYTGYYFIVPFDTTLSGTGDNFTFSGGNVTLTDAGASFTQADVGKQITIPAGSALSPGNEGTFTIATVADANNVTYANASGVTEAYAGTWTLGGYVSEAATTGQSFLNIASSPWMRDQHLGCIIEVLSGACAGQNRLCVGYDEAVTNSTVVSGTGDSFSLSGTEVTLTDAGANFSQLHIGVKITIPAGSAITPGNEGTFTITDVLSPTSVKYTNATGATEAYTGTWTLQRDFTFSGGNVTLVDAGAEFSQRLVGKKITITGSTTPGNDNTFTVVSVPTPTSLTYANGSGATENFPGTWSTQSWLTPSRDFSTNPGAAQFRFVRPTTKINGAAGQIVAKNDGAGTLQIQSLFMEGGGRMSAQQAMGPVQYSHVVANSNPLVGAFPLLFTNCSTVAITGSRYNPHTFAFESGNTTSQAGTSSFVLQFAAGVGLVAMRVTALTLSQSYITGAPLTACQSVSINQGTRVGTTILFDCGIASGNTLFGAIINSGGYARTRFTGVECPATLAPYQTCPGLMLVNSTANIGGGVDFTTLPKCEIGLELQRSYVWSSVSNGLLLGVATKIGMYIHSGSCYFQSMFAPGMPQIRGKLVGDISMDRVTRKSTWEAAWLVNVSDPSEVSMVKKGYISLY